jgi:AraC-like DNA-binding protein
MRGSKRGLYAVVVAVLKVHPDWSLTQIAESVRVHRHTLAAHIRSASGLTFRKWRTQERAAGASKLLGSRPDLSIKEIGALLGFNSTRAFDRFIRQATGRTPSELRLLNHEDNSST